MARSLLTVSECRQCQARPKFSGTGARGYVKDHAAGTPGHVRTTGTLKKCSVQHSGVHHPEGLPADLDAMAHSFSFGMMTMIGPLVDVEAASVTFSPPRFLHVLCCVSVCVTESFDGGIWRGAVRLERHS